MSYVLMAALFVLPYFWIASCVAIETAWQKVFGGLPALFLWFNQPRWQPPGADGDDRDTRL